MNAILDYARVLTGEQDLEGQRRRLQKAGALRISEDISSGRKFARPGLTALLEYARQDDVLCVVRLDRLGRSLRELLETVKTLKASGVALQSLKERLDTSSAAGELVFHVFGAIAHFERRLIAECTKDGLVVAAAKDRLPGRPDLDPEMLLADYALVDTGLTPTQAARQFGIGRSTLYHALSERTTSSIP